MLTVRSLFLVICLFGARAAWAQPSLEESREAGAKAYFERGDAHFKAARYLEARAEFSAGYELSRRPLFLFNMAECSRLNGDADIARETYERYLREAPTGSQVALARQRLAALNARPAGPMLERPAAKPDPSRSDPSKAAPPAPPPAKPTSTASTSATRTGGATVQPCAEGASCWAARDGGRTKRLVGLGVGGGGAVLLLTGVYFWRHAASLGDDVTDACAKGCDWNAVKGKYEDSQSAERKQWVFLGLGTAAVAAGGALYYLGVRERALSGVAVVPHADGAAVSWRGTW